MVAEQVNFAVWSCHNEILSCVAMVNDPAHALMTACGTRGRSTPPSLPVQPNPGLPSSPPPPGRPGGTAAGRADGLHRRGGAPSPAEASRPPLRRHVRRPPPAPRPVVYHRRLFRSPLSIKLGGRCRAVLSQGYVRGCRGFGWGDVPPPVDAC